jgi:hypothetical protein
LFSTSTYSVLVRLIDFTSLAGGKSPPREAMTNLEAARLGKRKPRFDSPSLHSDGDLRDSVYFR